MTRPGAPIGESIRYVEELRAPTRLAERWQEVPRLLRDALGVAWRASRRDLIATLAMQGGAGITMTLQVLAAQHVLAELLKVNEGGSNTGLIPAFVVLIGSMVVSGALVALAEQRQRLLGELVAQHAMRQIIGIATRVDLAAFENPKFHDQIDRARTSAIIRSIQLVTSLSAVTLNLLTSAGIAVALLVMEPLLLPLVLVSAIPLLLATIRNSRHAYGFEWAMTPDNRERTYLMELLTRREAAKEIRVFGATAFLKGRYDVLNAERLRRMREFLRRRLGVALVGTIGTSVGLGLALIALALLISSGRIGVSTALAAGAAMQLLSTRLVAAMSGIGQLVEAGMFVDDYNAFLRLLPALEESTSAEPAANGSGPRRQRARFNGVAVKGVSFTYPETTVPVLEDVSMHIDPGEVVALVGENGSGKTTLVKLICQLYSPVAGHIAWAGADGAEVDAKAVRDDTTVVFQDFLQYYLTAGDNIALGRVQRDATPEAIRGAARQAGAHEFLRRLPEGYETRLGRQFADGYDLSIGQWQRLSLARAFFRGGGFLVLDEPTASLDPKAEYALFQEMRKLWRGRSVLLVSHRFSSVRSADRIYVLRDGRMIEDGDHAALMAADGHYAELFSLQAAAYLDQTEQPSGDHKNAPASSVSSA